MLNMFSNLEMTPKPLPRFGTGACLPVPTAAATPVSTGTVAFRRPSATTGPVAGSARHLALTAFGQAAGRVAASDQQSAYYKTLTIADGAGDLGPHPAREPV